MKIDKIDTNKFHKSNNTMKIYRREISTTIEDLQQLHIKRDFQTKKNVMISLATRFQTTFAFADFREKEKSMIIVDIIKMYQEDL